MSIQERKTEAIMEPSKINIESLLKGNLAGLNEKELFTYYKTICDKLGINYETKPFDIIETKDKQGNVKKSIYPNKECASQLRNKYKIRLKILNEENIGNSVYKVNVYATTPEGAEDEDIGTANIKGLSGDYLAEAMMKAVTRGKRRVILSISGLGFSDEPSADYETPPQVPEKHTVSASKLQQTTPQIDNSQPEPEFQKIETKPVFEEVEFSFGDETKEVKEKPVENEEPKVEFSADKVEIVFPEDKKKGRKTKQSKKADLSKVYNNEDISFMNKPINIETPAPYKMMKLPQKEYNTPEIYEKMKEDWFASIFVMDSNGLDDGNILAYREAINSIVPEKQVEIETRYADLQSDPNELGTLLVTLYREAIGGIVNDEMLEGYIDESYIKIILADIEKIEKFCKMIQDSEKSAEEFMMYAEQMKIGWDAKKLSWAYRYATSRGLY